MILLRHGQSEFNVRFAVDRRDPGIVDPPLTPLGRQQIGQAAEALAGERIRRILASPYTRTLQTAALLAERLDLPVLVHPVVRERFAFTCDVGTPRTGLSRTWPDHDFSHLEEVWWPAQEEPLHALLDRAALFRAEMAALPDWSDTLVVTHWGFILAMTGERLENGEWRRCDPTGPCPEDVTLRH
ncbi:histidine phosphatase family protein [Rhodovastum atsumiense]|uniref:Histidine phosphatase family protein n=1 Tax=Rhodovastum atsumiense TaxID=504468 RepID=A0A5M6IMJ6_9PROT|nr:histidine phosphatase family protein [Rhodovastum atsumiense]KAA5609490.1 histidine phosphatase family protein [Rhodovastum atsumiense]